MDPALTQRNKLSGVLQDLNDEQRRAVLDDHRVVMGEIEFIEWHQHKIQNLMFKLPKTR